MKKSYRQYIGLLVFCCLFTNLWAQQKTVSGQVTDTLQNPIPGVNVLLKGENKGTLTDIAGRYAILASPNDTLVFSYLGFQTQEIALKGETTLNLQLQEQENALSQVVINAGYYTTTERERTGSIAQVSGEELELQPVGNPLQGLQGRMPGVQVVQGSGVRGLATSIQIRGQNSLRNTANNNGNLPLYIIDGVPINSSPIRSSGLLTNAPGLDPLNTLNLNNIESIEVLKDADATAIYGSRGANGVVLITTKKARHKDGKLQVEAGLYSGVAEASHQMELLNTQQYLAMRREAFANDGEEPTAQNAPDLTVWDQNRETDWQEELFGGLAEITNAHLSLAGGNQYTSFLIGGNYQKETTVFPGDFGYRKATTNLNLNHRTEDDRLQINFSANYGVDQNELFNDSFVDLALSLAPNAPRLYDDEGNLNWEEGTWSNPLATLYKKQKVTANNLLSNLSLDYRIAKGFNLKTNLGYTFLRSEELIKTPKRAYNPSFWENVQATSVHSNIQRNSYLIEPQLLYNTDWGKLGISTLAGLTFQERQSSTLISVGQGYAHESLIGNLAAADQVRVNTHQNITYRYHAIFGRIGLQWDQKYYLNFTGRRDGSSRFGPGKRFANFGAIGAAWLFSEEKGLKENLPWLSFGKLRGSYGTTGSDQIPDYGYVDTYQPTLGAGGLYATRLTNPDYSWEVNKKLEAAVKIGLLNNRIQTEVSWYRNRSTNQLVGYPLPATTGFTTVQANLPAVVQNTGWEISLNTLNVKSTNFQWQTNLNLSFPKNELLEFDRIEETPYRNTYRVGEPLAIALLYQYEGINQETGFYKVADVNGDGVYNFEDKVVVRNLGRTFFGGLQNSLSYKGVQLQFLWEYVRQDNLSYFAQASTPGFQGNQPTTILNAWQNPGDDTRIQKLSQSFPGFMAHYDATQSELAVEDASFFRLKTLTLSYNFPSTWIDKLKISSLRLFAHGQNLFTFTDYLGLDPQGGMALPPLRTITTGLQVKF